MPRAVTDTRSLSSATSVQGAHRRAAPTRGTYVPLGLAFGQVVRELRLDAGFTQEEFADRCGFFRTYLSRIETGKANPTLSAIEVLASALGVAVSEMLLRAEVIGQ
jgi:ribosome-binding protein aMBF1 (putative translation factor)